KPCNQMHAHNYLEVSRVHSQSEGVQLTEAEKTTGEIINFADSISNCSHHGCSVLLHRGRAGAQVLPVGEVSLGLRVHCQHPGSTLKQSIWVQIISHNPYLPGDSITADLFLLSSHLSTKGFDCVLWIKHSYFAFYTGDFGPRFGWWSNSFKQNLM
uniref:Uncharacterized protein n=1 Tax=Maylandia zebra TaxID=106582 RepID=A0A3P9D4J8_9CICH